MTATVASTPVTETEAAIWRRLVADYRHALQAWDRTPNNARQVLAASNQLAAARLALFHHLDACTPETPR